MQTLTFLLTTLIEFYVMVLLLRIWMQLAKTDFYNPFSQFVVKATQPVVSPLRRILPSMGSIDTASLLVALVLCLVKVMVFFFAISFAPVIWIAAVMVLVKTIGILIFWVMMVRALMSWVSQGRSPIEYVLMQLTEPFMAPIRRILPAMGGIDFSGMVVILALYALNIAVGELLALTGNMLLPGLWAAL